MTIPRALLVTAFLAATGVALVLLRQDMARCSHRIQLLHKSRVAVEHEAWARQMELARLRVPAAVRERVNELGLSVAPPLIERKATKAPEARSDGLVHTSD